MALARVAFMDKRFEEAEKWYSHIAMSQPEHSPEAKYWRAVCQYNLTHDAAPLVSVAQELAAYHSGSIWARKATPWLPAEQTQRAA